MKRRGITNAGLSRLWLCLWAISLAVVSLAAIGLPAAAARPPVAQAASRVADKWAVVVGISQFADPKVPALKYSAKDAEDFYNYLIDPSAGRFAKDHVRLLLNENASKVNIMDALGDSFLPHAAMPEDLVVIYLSTHGSPAGADIRGVNYVVAYDTQVDKLFATGLEMKQLMRTIKERVHTSRIVLIMDTCYSGAGAEGGHKGITRTNVDTQEVAQGIGSMVISSSSPDQRSWESDQLKNSYFTKYLVDSLRSNEGKVSVEQAFNSMRQRVQAEVLRDKGEMQTPVMASAFVGPPLMLGVPPSVSRSAPYLVLPSEQEAPAGTKIAPGTSLVSYAQHMRLANQLIARHKLWDAAHELEQATQLNPGSVEAYIVSADVYDAQRRYPQALEAAKRAVINDRDSSRGHEALSRAYLRTGEYGEALRQAQLAVTLDPANSAAHNLLGYIQEHKFTRVDQAEQEYRKALELNPLNTRALVNLGLLLESERNDRDQAEKLYRSAVASDADDWEAHFALGRLLGRKGQYAEAETELVRAIQLDPSNSALHSDLGTILAHDRSRQEEAEKELRKGIELSPDSGDAHLDLARFLEVSGGRVDEAEAEFRKAIELNCGLDDARVGLGNLLIAQRNSYDEADKQFRKALTTNPKNAAAHVGVAMVYMQLYRNFQGAEDELRKALRLNPNDPVAHDQLGLLLSTGFERYDEARQEFEKAIKLDPASARPHYHLGRLLVDRQKAYGEAMQEFQKALAADPGNSHILTTIGWLQVSHYKKYKEGEANFRKAIELNVGDAEAHYRLGMLLSEHYGWRKQGEPELRKAHQLDPSNGDYTRAFSHYCH